MTELDDHELLAEYARTGSEAAFAVLVARYVNLVYSAALAFHRQSASRRGNHAGGLHHSGAQSRRVAARHGVVRLAVSNRAADGGQLCEGRNPPPAPRTGGLYAIHLDRTGPAAWEQIAPLLDEAMGRLGETDRNAIVLRFFENKTAQEVGAALKLNEAAAHKRVNRALEKLHHFLPDAA
jgi:hypothetical protein